LETQRRQRKAGGAFGRLMGEAGRDVKRDVARLIDEISLKSKR
jgi:hypothetical protein